MDDLVAALDTPKGQSSRKKVLVVGAGIAGLSASWLLSRSHDVVLVEANDYIGGHSNTIDLGLDGSQVPVDTGFIVYNPQNYPNLSALFDLLGVETAATDMSFSVSKEKGTFEYSGGDGGGLFAQPVNLVRPRFWRMIRDVLRFYKNSENYASLTKMSECTLGELLASEKYSHSFYEDHLGPMGAAIWSSDNRNILDYPAHDFLRFFNNHGLTKLKGRPQWRTVVNGSRQYVQKILSDMEIPVFKGVAVEQIVKVGGTWSVKLANSLPLETDEIVFACHSDQAVSLIQRVAPTQAAVLSKMRYGANKIVVHSDTALMPRRQKAWASWNYIEHDQSLERPSVSYWMNKLQHLPTEVPIIATLNPAQDIDGKLTYAQFDYAHPIFDTGARRARKDLWPLQGKDGLWFCGAYLGDGFHEDGIQAGLAVAELLGGVARPWERPNQNARLGLAQSLVASKVIA